MHLIEATSKGQSQTEIAFKQALFINEISRKLVDAEVDVTYCTPEEKSGVKIFETKSKRERDRIKRNLFDRWVEHLLTFEEVKAYPRAIKALDGIINYLHLPKGIYKARDRHGKALKKIRANIRKRQTDPIENFLERVDKIILRKKTGRTSAARAMTVCVSASIYADIQYKKRKAAGEGTRWLNEYRDAMKAAYPKIKTDEKLMNAITSLK